MVTDARFTAASKCRSANRNYRVGDGDGCERVAIVKCTISNRSYGVSDGDGYKSFAASKCRSANRNYRVGMVTDVSESQ